MSINILDMPYECSQIAVLLHNNVIMFESTRDAERYCKRMKLRVTGRDKQGKTYLITAQKEDNTL